MGKHLQKRILFVTYCQC